MEPIVSNRELRLAPHRRLFVRQVRELVELLGFETRNKYQVSDEREQAVAYVAELQKGALGFLLRQFLGHWRTFEIHFFTPDRVPCMKAVHPFRFFFQRLEVSDIGGRKLGAVQQRWALFSKRFDVENAMGQVVLEMSSPLWKPWTFPFSRGGREMASVKKKWSGVFAEIFTDKDNFMIEFGDPRLTEDERKLILASAVFVDLRYFEAKAG